MSLTVRLPLLWCPDCGSQLVTHLFAASASTLVCLFCARRRTAAGERVCPLHPASAGLVPGAAEALPVEAALALLGSLGARPLAGAA